MSYILDAIRKSEQQRQASQPDNATERLLVDQPQPSNKPANWIIFLIIVNMSAVMTLAWFVFQKYGTEKRLEQESAHFSTQGAMTEKERISRETNPRSSFLNQTEVVSTKPAWQKSIVQSQSIAQLLEEKNKAAKLPVSNVSALKIPTKTTSNKKQERPATKYDASKLQAKADMPISQESFSEKSKMSAKVLDVQPEPMQTGLPKFTVNVYSYAENPEDRFVVIDMVKYKKGQLIKGAGKLQEIYPDHIEVLYGNATYKVDRH